MAKKSKTKKTEPVEAENLLPQNIAAVGEHVEEAKNIYISQPVYKAIHKFSENKTSVECGGMLIGSVIEEFGKTNIVIKGFIEAKHSEGTATTLKFTHETWDYVHGEMDKKYPEMKIVGWIHTHPNYGIFLSEYDKFIQENFFNDENQIAYVVDPVQGIEGFYFWINGAIERCKGFYVFDKTGVKLDVESQNKKAEVPSSRNPWSVVSIVLAAAVVVLFAFNITLGSKFSSLQNKQNALADDVQRIPGMQRQIEELWAELGSLKAEIGSTDMVGTAENEETAADAVTEPGTVPDAAPETTAEAVSGETTAPTEESSGSI